MTTLNPQFAPRGHWCSLRAGDALNIPWEWLPQLESKYLIQVDPPGVVPLPIKPCAPARLAQNTRQAADAGDLHHDDVQHRLRDA
jgi:hypothetical protein